MTYLERAESALKKALDNKGFYEIQGNRAKVTVTSGDCKGAIFWISLRSPLFLQKLEQHNVFVDPAIVREMFKVKDDVPMGVVNKQLQEQAAHESGLATPEEMIKGEAPKKKGGRPKKVKEVAESNELSA